MFVKFRILCAAPFREMLGSGFRFSYNLECEQKKETSKMVHSFICRHFTIWAILARPLIRLVPLVEVQLLLFLEKQKILSNHQYLSIFANGISGYKCCMLTFVKF